MYIENLYLYITVYVQECITKEITYAQIHFSKY